MTITFVGPASENSGIGSTIRQFAKAVLASGYQLAIVDTDSGAGRRGFDNELGRFAADELIPAPDSICIYVVGAHGIAGQAKAICESAKLQKAFNVAFVWWELPDVPYYWSECLQAFDAIVVASEFVHSAFANAVPGVPVLLAKQPIDLPGDISPNRERFGIPKNCFTAYTGFDVLSEPARKNPMAGVSAFREAFPGLDDVRLVVKCSTAGVPKPLLHKLDPLREMVAQDQRILLVDERLKYDQLLSLYASCDVALSLHRSEGLALIPLEFMRLGKAVVATGWSGNMGFMTYGDCALVRFSFIPTDESCGSYAPSLIGIRSKWAEPNIADAAKFLKSFYQDRQLLKDYGGRALRRSEAYDSEARGLRFLAELVVIRDRFSRRSAEQFSALGRHLQRLEREEFYRRRNLGKGQVALWAESAFNAYQRHLGWRLKRGGLRT